MNFEPNKPESGSNRAEDPLELADNQPSTENPYVTAEVVSENLGLVGRTGESRVSLFVSWAVILGICGAMFALIAYFQLNPPALDPEKEGGFSGELFQVNLVGKMLVGQTQLVPGSDEQVLQQLSQFNRGSLEERYCYAIFLNEFDGPSAAIEQLENTDDLVAEREYEPSSYQVRLREILGSLFSKYDSDDLDSTDVTLEDKNFLTVQLGWVGQLALYPPDTPNETDRKEILEQAKSSMLVFMGACLFGFLLFLFGIFMAVVFLYLIASGKLKPHLQHICGRGIVYVETFAIWMVIFVGLQILIPLLGKLPLDKNFIKYLTPLIFFVSLFALTWPVIRGVSFADVCKDIGWEWKNPILEALYGMVSYAALLPALGVAVIVVVILAALTSLWQTSDDLGSSSGAGHPIIQDIATGDINTMIFVVVTACIAAPIVEETMFRGVLYRHLRDLFGGNPRWMSVALSAVFNSLLFASIHPQGIIGIPLLTTLAIGISLVREWRNSLIGSITMHAINNGLVTVFLFLLM